MLLDDVSRCLGHAINEAEDIEPCALRSHCQRFTQPFRSGLGSFIQPDLSMVRGFCDLLIEESHESI